MDIKFDPPPPALHSDLPPPEYASFDLERIVDRICTANLGSPMRVRQSPHAQPLPSPEAVIAIVNDLRRVIFPGYFGMSELSAENMRFHIGSILDGAARSLVEQIRRGLCFTCSSTHEFPECGRRSENLATRFLSGLPRICELAASDVTAAYESDPAATSPNEAIFCYPGVHAITTHRIAHELYLLGIPLIPRMMGEHAHGTTGIDIHPGARIGSGFFIDHGTGVVIGETTVIGDRVKLFQGVTLGAKSFPKDEFGNPIKGIPRHPIVEDDVIIYSGATILGRVTIGRGSIIGGNVWLTNSVPAGSRVSQGALRTEDFEGGAGI